MTTLSTRLTLAQIAQMLAPCLYSADCDYTGTIETRQFTELPLHVRQLWLTRAENVILSGIGHLDAKARGMAIASASTDHDIWGAFDEQGAKLVEAAMDTALSNYDVQLQKLALDRMNPFSPVSQRVAGKLARVRS